jgi:hypothetical protein
MGMDRRELAAFRRTNRRGRAIVWWTMVGGAVAIAYAAALAWTFIAGVVVGSVLLIAAVSIFRWWDRSVMLKRFPELAGWRRR